MKTVKEIIREIERLELECEQAAHQWREHSILFNEAKESAKKAEVKEMSSYMDYLFAKDRLHLAKEKHSK
jgi:hypothetical protein